MSNNKDICYPIRIAHIIGKMCAGGVESVVFNYYRAIDHSKYQFDFYYDADSSVEPPQDLIEMGARFIKVPPYQHIFQYLKTLKKHFIERDYFIVHSHLNTLSVFPLFAAWQSKIPIRIAHNHSVPRGKEYARNSLKNILKQFSTLFANHYFACSEEAGRWLFGNKLFDEQKVTVIHNAIDFSRFFNEEKDETICKQFGLSSNSLVIGHIGRFTAAKNHQKIISIFEAVCKHDNNAKLLLVGDGELYEEIHNRVKVAFAGKVSDPEKYYSVIDVLILPSIFEGIPVTVIEAQIAGIPCVISNIVNSEVVISDACYYLGIDETDEKWANTIISLVNKRANLTENSQNYNIEVAVQLLERKYSECLRS